MIAKKPEGRKLKNWPTELDLLCIFEYVVYIDITKYNYSIFGFWKLLYKLSCPSLAHWCRIFIFWPGTQQYVLLYTKKNYKIENNFLREKK